MIHVISLNLDELITESHLSDIVDIKPANMEELTEVITAAEFHPLQCNVFMYSSSKGTIKLADMRDSALCDQHAKRGFCHTSMIINYTHIALYLQNTRKRKTLRIVHSSRRSSHQYQMSGLVEMVVTSYPGTIYL